MFNNPGARLRDLAYLSFLLSLLGAVIALVIGLITLKSGFGGGLIVSAVLEPVIGWVSTIAMLAAADAAENAVVAAENTAEILESLKKNGLYAEETEEEEKVPQNVAVNPDGKIPAWQRVEMEREAAAKAENQ